MNIHLRKFSKQKILRAQIAAAGGEINNSFGEKNSLIALKVTNLDTSRPMDDEMETVHPAFFS